VPRIRQRKENADVRILATGNSQVKGNIITVTSNEKGVVFGRVPLADVMRPGANVAEGLPAKTLQ
jgi:hypothetical protein